MTTPPTANDLPTLGGAPSSDLPAFKRIAVFLTLSIFVGSFYGAMVGEKTTFLLKEVMHLTAGGIGTLNLIVGIPTYIQPFLGAGADLFPLFGSHRRSYFVIAFLVQIGALWTIASLHEYHYVMVVSLLLLKASGGVMSAVIINAVMVAVGNGTGRLGQLQSLQVFVPAVLSILYAARLGGYVTQNWSYHRAYSTATALLFLYLPLVFLIDEKPRVHRRPGGHDPTSRAEQRVARRQERIQTMAELRRASPAPGLWAIVGFVFYLILTPGTNNAQLYYMRDVLHFSKQFIGSLGMYGSAGAIIAMAVFAAASRRMPVRSLAWGAWLMDCLIYPEMLLLRGHLSGEVLTFLGAWIGVWYNLCLMTLAARACPPGVEGTVYGLVMSAIAFAGVLSDKIGGNLYDYFGPLNMAHHWTITHGWDCSLLVGLAFTLVGFLFIPYLPAWAKSPEPLGSSRVIDPELD